MLANPPFFPPTLAFSADACDSASRLQWVGRSAAAVEFSPDPDRLERLPEMIRPFVQAKLPVRFHTRYFQHELGHADPRRAASALDVHKRTLEAMAGLSEPVVTVHTGLDPAQPVREATFAANLSRLVEHARGLGIHVCLENLRHGHSANPWSVLEWTAASGAMITLDLGHALGSALVQDGNCSMAEYVEVCANRLFEVHIYGREDEYGHHPIEDMGQFEPILARLQDTRCTWWTIELHAQADVLATERLIRSALGIHPDRTSAQQGSGPGALYQRGSAAGADQRGSCNGGIEPSGSTRRIHHH